MSGVDVVMGVDGSVRNIRDSSGPVQMPGAMMITDRERTMFHKQKLGIPIFDCGA